MTTAFKLGSIVQDAITGLKSVFVAIAADAHYMSFESPLGTDYAVTAGTTLYVGKLSGHMGTANCSIRIGYGDNGVADGAAAPTNPVYLTPSIIFASANTEYFFEVYFAVPAGKFPFAITEGGLFKGFIYGVEL